MPPVEPRTCPSIQSHLHFFLLFPLQTASVVCGWYQNDRMDVPVSGTLMDWDRELSPSGSLPLATPSSAEPLPLCAVPAGLGGAIPAAVQDASPDSNPPFCTTDCGADGVTAAVAADGAEEPTALVAETVKV
ncbi:hypothetical protein D9M72_539710 [compost metagenome]